MDITPPHVDMAFMPEGTRYVTYAKDQPQYLPLPALKTPDGRVVSAWKPTKNDLLLLANGVSVYLTLHTGNEPLQPIMITVGPPDLRDKP